MSTHAADTLDKLYAELPKIACRRKCGEACGPIPMSRIELERITLRVGFEPPFLAPTRDLDCPMLNPTGTCNVYDLRPMICRLYGLVDVPAMRCRHGCIPDRWLSDAEAKRFLRRAAEAGR